jgi:hypothetical protein
MGPGAPPQNALGERRAVDVLEFSVPAVYLGSPATPGARAFGAVIADEARGRVAPWLEDQPFDGNASVRQLPLSPPRGPEPTNYPPRPRHAGSPGRRTRPSIRSASCKQLTLPQTV